MHQTEQVQIYFQRQIEATTATKVNKIILNVPQGGYANKIFLDSVNNNIS